MSLSERIKELIDTEYSSESSFARQVKVNPKTINNLINSQHSPNHSVVQRILIGIPNLSAEWLCRGEGPMWLDERNEKKTTSLSVIKGSEEKIDIDITIRDMVGQLKTLRQEMDEMKKKK